MAIETYRWLVAGGYGDPFDRHVFACALAVAIADPLRPPAVALGLSAECLAAVAGRYFPHAPGLLAGLDPDEDGMAAQAIEEPDLRSLLIANGSCGSVEEAWLAHIIARRSLEPNHLWQDLGLSSRGDLGQLMRRHFAPLAEANFGDMKWKKFFYRQLCQAENIVICKSPVCEQCDDFRVCFGTEDGASLLGHSHPAEVRPV
ncbi:nitrogen fixation protein NifQ [Magnetospirillum sp. UT-4]|uniref:nitrogen fixation protein NifQ n=1 Tax=Magnetospirillum sp. UT-4 TaxID=2681467 RepID=UPI00137F4167|nr:nitrogen fixation protein NifQ [Magnetospirillum sp. UT-4]CAA7615280.1 NifQ protein [Magnetospirillum sp. UT-4]